jgi:hypothetical protein
MKLRLHIAAVVLSLPLCAQVKKQVYQDAFLKVEYHTRNGQLDGKYISYYANGKKKSSGSFKDNLRVGTWQVWDSAGVVTERIIKVDSAARNEQGFFPNYYLRQRDVYLESRLWRDIHKDNNPLLFSSPFADTLFRHVLADSIAVYADEDFLSPIPREEIARLAALDHFDVVQYKLKEDWFIDRTRGCCTFRPLGICPVLIPRNSKRGETIHLGWLYFPDLRALLAAQPVADNSGVAANLDDVFWYRKFASIIYRETNVYDKPIETPVKTEKQAMLEAERIALSLVEWEHYYWLHPDKKPFNYLNEH